MNLSEKKSTCFASVEGLSMTFFACHPEQREGSLPETFLHHKSITLGEVNHENRAIV